MTLPVYLSLLIALLWPSVTYASLSRCKYTPESQQWPTTAKWAAFNESILGYLLRPAPPAAACHPQLPEYSPDKCALIRNSWNSSQWHSDSPTSNDWQNFNNYSCLPDSNYPCTGNGYPIYVVNASTTESVQHAVDFARENNLRLNIKSTGHDFLGRYLLQPVVSFQSLTPLIGQSSQSHFLFGRIFFEA
jgi:hypothetical protein